MPALTDVSLGLANEATPGTFVTPARFPEPLPVKAGWRKSVQQGKGMRVASRVARSGRRVVTIGDGDLTSEIELATRGFGLLWESALGAGTSTLVLGSTYQQLFTLATGITLPSRTLQTGTVDATGTVNPVSYLGCAVDTWELTIPNDGIPTLKLVWDAMNKDTAQAYAAPSYVSAPNLFHWGQAAFTLGGTVVAPTTTALATGGTASTAIRSLKITGDNGLVKDRFNGGGAGRKSRQLLGGNAKLTGELEIEYVDNVVRDAYLGDTPLALTATFTTTETLSSGFAQFQVVLSEIKLNGDIPAGDGELPIIKVPFDILDNLTAAQPLWVAHRTADAAL